MNAALAITISSSPALSDPTAAGPGSCEQQSHYNTGTGSKVHLAICRGDDIKLDPAETVSADLLAQEITDESHLAKLKDHGFNMTGGKILGNLVLRSHHFDLPRFHISSEFDGLVDFSDSHFDGSLSLQGSILTNGFLAAHLIVEGSAFIGDSDDSDYNGARKPKGSLIRFVRAPHARIMGDVIIAGATVSDDIDFSSSQIAGSLTVMHVLAGQVNFAADEVGNQLVLYNCIIHPNDAGDVGHDINLYSIRTKQSVYLNRVTVADTRTAVHDDIYIDGAEIDGDLIILGTHLSRINARSLTISGSLAVGLNKNPPPVWTTWGNESVLDLTNARLGGIRSPDRLDVWPRWIYFHNMSFKAFNADFCDAAPCRHSDAWYGEWLGKQAGERKSFEPYKEVIDLLLAQGQVLEAADLGVLGHDVERTDAYEHGELIRWLLLTVYRYTVGYGYKLYWIFFSIAFFVTLGALIFRRTREARRRHMPFGLFYSFDLLIPIIRLRESHYKIDLKGTARYYFYFHKLVGWALSLILVAALTGITK